jgi:glutamine amidotransferase
MSVVIVDTGCANLSSVVFAMQRLGVTPQVSCDAHIISGADRVILPGVGAAPRALAQLHDRGLFEVLKGLSQPLLGICLGMQLLFESLEEGGVPHKGLGLIRGDIKELETGTMPSPHMGWNTLEVVDESPLLTGIGSGDYAYFVHSFAAPKDTYTLAHATYGQTFSAVVRNKNVYGCQFHPERSSQTGAKILENFVRLPS